MDNKIDLNPQQMELLASLLPEQVQALISAAKSMKEYKDDLDAAKTFFVTLTNQGTGWFAQTDPSKYNKLRAVLEKRKDELFYVLYDVITINNAGFAAGFELVSAKELYSRCQNIDIKIITYLTKVRLYSNQQGASIHITVNGIQSQRATADPKTLEIFKGFENLLFICRSDIACISQLQSAGFITK